MRRTYGDFKRLAEVIFLSDLKPENGQQIPELPEKVNENGYNKPAELL
jgi:hypothetical protein